MSAPSAPLPPLRSQESPPIWRDIRVIRWVGQILVVAVVLGVAWWLYGNVRTNLSSSGLPTGFDFLGRRFGAAIPGIEGAADFSILRAFGAGYLNTLRVIVVGIPACTILGIVIGIARLSDNVAVRLAGTIYVETFRNVPVLVWIFLSALVLTIGSLPQIAEAPTPGGVFVVSNRGVGIPWLNPDASLPVFLGVLLLASVAAALVVSWRGRVNARTGEPARGGIYGLGTVLVGIAVAHVVAGGALALEGANLNESGLGIQGGLIVDPYYLGLTAALVLYTASHVAEIVRGSIQAIPKGQSEAANAVALSTFQRYRFVILPQAFRIMIPPLANQYLNITKNSSLAVGVSYVEITSVFGRIVNNATPAVQGVVILMALYLSFSLTISLVANVINRRLALETR